MTEIKCGCGLPLGWYAIQQGLYRCVHCDLKAFGGIKSSTST